MSSVTFSVSSGPQPTAARVAMTTAEIIKLPNKRAWALEMARRGLYVFPLLQDSKDPLHGSHGHLDATLDLDLIREIWTEPLSGGSAQYNIGVSPRDGRVIVIDLDEKEGRDGINAYKAMGGEIAGMVSKTPTGGLHIFCLGNDLRTGAGRIAPGIDTRTQDGYVVGPGSTIGGVAYELVLDEPMRPVPQFVVDKIGTRAMRDARLVTRTSIEPDQAQNIERAIGIAQKAEPAVQGCWHDYGFRLGCEMARVGLSPEKAVEVLLEHWVPRGDGFKSQAQFERDVLGGYHSAVRDGHHGIHSVDAQCEAFKGITIVPPPADDTSAAESPFAGAPSTGPAWRRVSPVSLAGIEVAPREWIVDQWLSPGHVTLLFGEGGTGKSLLAQQLMTACATGTKWLGMKTTPCTALGLFCEDDENELHRRQTRINAIAGVGFADLGNMSWISAAATENDFVVFDRDGRMELMPAFHRFMQEVRETQARLVVCDTAACLFGGDENRRREVTKFLRVAMSMIAQETNAAVLMPAHPSRSGVTRGDPDGGSTAWTGSARARWTLSKAKPGLGGPADLDPAERVLALAKSNYSASGIEMKVRFDQGGFMPVVPPTLSEQFARIRRAEIVFLTMLNRYNLSGREVSPTEQSKSYAPKVFAAMPERAGMLYSDLKEAMAHLFSQCLIEVVESGPQSRRQKFIRPTIIAARQIAEAA